MIQYYSEWFSSKQVLAMSLVTDVETKAHPGWVTWMSHTGDKLLSGDLGHPTPFVGLPR